LFLKASFHTEFPELVSTLGAPSTPQKSAPKLPTDEETGNFSKYVIFCIGKEKEKMYGLKSKLISKSPTFYEVVYTRKEINYPQFKPAVFKVFIKVIIVELHKCSTMEYYAGNDNYNQ